MSAAITKLDTGLEKQKLQPSKNEKRVKESSLVLRAVRSPELKAELVVTAAPKYYPLHKFRAIEA